MAIAPEPEMALAAQSTVLKALQSSSNVVTMPPATVATAFPGSDRVKRCEALLYWAETNGLNVKSHAACDPEEMCEEWPCGPIDFELALPDVK